MENNLRRFTSIAGLGMLLAGALFAPKVYAASLNCEQAKGRVEAIICADEDLVRLEETVASLGQDAMERPINLSRLRQIQRTWLSRRNKCADSNCVEQAYFSQINKLSDVLGYKYRLVYEPPYFPESPHCLSWVRMLNKFSHDEPPMRCEQKANDSFPGLIQVRTQRQPMSETYKYFSAVRNFKFKADPAAVFWKSRSYDGLDAESLQQAELADQGGLGLEYSILNVRGEENGLVLLQHPARACDPRNAKEPPQTGSAYAWDPISSSVTEYLFAFQSIFKYSNSQGEPIYFATYWDAPLSSRTESATLWISQISPVHMAGRVCVIRFVS